MKNKVIEILEEFDNNFENSVIPQRYHDELATLIAKRFSEPVTEEVPNLSGLNKGSTDEFIKDFVEMTAKNVLSVFVALGLKTHIEATVVNDADGNSYKLSFHNTSHPTKQEWISVEEIRCAISDYMRSEGCSCCENVDTHEQHEKRIAELLNVPMYDDNSGYDFYQFNTAPPQLNKD